MTKKPYYGALFFWMGYWQYTGLVSEAEAKIQVARRDTWCCVIPMEYVGLVRLKNISNKQ